MPTMCSQTFSKQLMKMLLKLLLQIEEFLRLFKFGKASDVGIEFRAAPGIAADLFLRGMVDGHDGFFQLRSLFRVDDRCQGIGDPGCHASVGIVNDPVYHLAADFDTRDTDDQCC